MITSIHGRACRSTARNQSATVRDSFCSGCTVGSVRGVVRPVLPPPLDGNSSLQITIRVIARSHASDLMAQQMIIPVQVALSHANHCQQFPGKGAHCWCISVAQPSLILWFCVIPSPEKQGIEHSEGNALIWPLVASFGLVTCVLDPRRHVRGHIFDDDPNDINSYTRWAFSA